MYTGLGLWWETLNAISLKTLQAFWHLVIKRKKLNEVKI